MANKHIERCSTPLVITAAAAESRQSCLTLCDPIEGSPPGSSVPGILQARILEWVAISFSSAWKWKVKMKLLSCVQLLATPWTAAYQAPLSMGFSRQEYWSGVPVPSLTHTHMRLIKSNFSSLFFFLCSISALIFIVSFPPYSCFWVQFFFSLVS